MLRRIYSLLCVCILHRFAESSVGRMVIPTFTIAGDTSSVNSSQNAIPEWLGSHKVECIIRSY